MYGAMKPGNIFFFLRLFFEYLLNFFPPKWQLELSKPLFECVFCMSSVWGIAFTAIAGHFSISVDYAFLILEIAGLV
jgi:hypothetical protein